ncbi:MAG: soluble lytic murein transglycosylase Slt [Idiomarinaceae bacterium HL-53]|nr:MAG: soluble lytic murein transglycosylase Slt [Idiomarinaceae bacterium HL-53]CUS47795.1 soluble lytic murein transglycosylase [Idiomarinaceae bacterium HL-53]
MRISLELLPHCGTRVWQTDGSNHPTMRNKIKQVFKKRRNPRLLFLRIACSVALVTLTFAVSAINQTVFAQETQLNPSMSIEQKRELFLETEQAIQERRFREARDGMQRLQSYPLYPYLEADFLKQNLSYANEPVIAEFLSAFEGTPLDAELRRPWLEFLVRQNDMERFLNYYQGGGGNELQCTYLDYLWKTSDNESALWPQVANQWLNGSSQPRKCDGVFAAWQNAGHRTEDLVWQRLKLAIEAREWGLARFLTRQLPEQKQYLGELLRRVKANPMTLMRFQEFVNKDARESEIVVAGMHNLIWRDTDSAEVAWAHFQETYSFSPEVDWDMSERFGITRAVRNEAGALAWFDRVPASKLSESGHQWLLATLLREGRFDRVVMFINALPAEEQEKAQWQYWRGRALKFLDFTEDSEAVWQALAQERNYYGFLASAQLGIQPSMAHVPVTYEPSAMAQLKAKPSVQRAFELFALGRALPARREWNILGYRGTYDEQVLSAVAAYEAGWHDQAIFGLAHTGQFNDVEKRFPIAFQDLIESFAASHDLDSAWVYAIARRESAFRPDAISRVGARGLMQVMPATANYVSNRTPGPNLGRITTRRLMQPDENVKIGTRYLSDLLGRTSNNWVIATAAYNAGLSVVETWLPEEPVAFDIWVETIPYGETRDYVKNVLAYQQIYTTLQGKNANVLERLVNIQIVADSES